MATFQQQLDAISANVQLLDANVSNVIGNVFSNLNFLSRYMTQQANLYNTVYYGLGNLNTGNLITTSNANIYGNLGIRGNTFIYGNMVVYGNHIINGNLNVDSGALFVDAINNRVGINITTPQYLLDVNGIANVSTLYVGTTPFTNASGRIMSIRQNSTLDTAVNGSLTGSVYNQFAFGAAREWVWAEDSGNSNVVYFGSTNATGNDPDFEYIFKRAVGMQITPATAVGNANDFTESLKVNGNANITGTMVFGGTVQRGTTGKSGIFDIYQPLNTATYSISSFPSAITPHMMRFVCRHTLNNPTTGGSASTNVLTINYVSTLGADFSMGVTMNALLSVYNGTQSSSRMGMYNSSLVKGNNSTSTTNNNTTVQNGIAASSSGAALTIGGNTIAWTSAAGTATLAITMGATTGSNPTVTIGTIEYIIFVSNETGGDPDSIITSIQVLA